MSSKKQEINKKLVSASLTLGLIASGANAAIASSHIEDSLFAIQEISSPSSQSLFGSNKKDDDEHKCGESKCGEAKCGEGKCGS